MKLATRIGFYTVLIGWTIVTIWTGNFIIRMSMVVIYFFITAIYLISLHSIKKAMRKLESTDEKAALLQNRCLVRGYLTLYMVNAVL